MKTRQAPPVPTLTGSRAARRYLYFTAAVTGAAIMVVEILGAKMLAPYVGTSHFVWTAQIAVTLVALAAGYYAGGWLVDRTARLGILYGCILAAAVYLCLTALVVEPIAYSCLRFNLALGSLAASTFLFFVPLALLAMVGPFAIRILTHSLTGVGGSVGRLTAISTLGSFLGTALIGYVLIPFFPNSVNLLLTAGCLMALAVAYFLVWGRAGSLGPLVLVAILAGAGMGVGGVASDTHRRFQFSEELFRGNSNFGMLQVIDTMNGRKRLYLNDYLTQDTYDTFEKKSHSLFTYMLHGLARAYTHEARDILCIGLGVGLVPMEFAREGARVDVVEINPAVVPVAARYFGLEPERLKISIGDGRYFINRSATQYDAVVLDAFLGDACPSHLMTREAFQGMRRILRPEGVLVINTFGRLSAGEDFFTSSLEQTLRAAFTSVRIHSSGNGNIFFVASSRPELKPYQPPNFDLVHDSCRTMAQEAYESKYSTDPSHGRILTDDYNPVDFYDAANREGWRRQMALSMQDL